MSGIVKSARRRLPTFPLRSNWMLMTVLLGEKTFLRFVLGIELLARRCALLGEDTLSGRRRSPNLLRLRSEAAHARGIPSFLLLRGMNMPSGKEWSARKRWRRECQRNGDYGVLPPDMSVETREQLDRVSAESQIRDPQFNCCGKIIPSPALSKFALRRMGGPTDTHRSHWVDGTSAQLPGSTFVDGLPGADPTYRSPSLMHGPAPHFQCHFRR
jgi:hypothetical protein